MSLQQGFNQLLTQAAIGMRLGPNFEAKQEMGQTKRQLKQVSKQAQAAYEGARSPFTGELRNDPEVAGSLAKRRADLMEKMFELKPTAQNYRLMRGARSISDRIMGEVGRDHMQQRGMALTEQRIKQAQIRQAIMNREGL